MQISLLSISNKMPKWIQDGFDEYAKRLSKDYPLTLIEIPPVKKRGNITQIIEDEGEKLLKAVPKSNRIIALDRLGASLSTEKLAKHLDSWIQTGRDISLLIGGAEGLSQHCLQKAEMKWSLSQLTFPHLLVRIIVAEQLYRAMSILKHHPYHRG